MDSTSTLGLCASYCSRDDPCPWLVDFGSSPCWRVCVQTHGGSGGRVGYRTSCRHGRVGMDGCGIGTYALCLLRYGQRLDPSPSPRFLCATYASGETYVPSTRFTTWRGDGEGMWEYVHRVEPDAGDWRCDASKPYVRVVLGPRRLREAGGGACVL